ncbi:hypothetical protein HYPSUDRAFT_206417 [Hypholoma sublateritium FD-334 SS-4]|uniref:Uncharacterized protein n=1 Tax=Hypholoma sublateritium (strain FD-334 SS-4) TaxID=945553 RepID=A0A0D2NDL2_HYPSF|nr:hypothetical protein HYPSUDRAFT_206417 [Hypholoma sublateritium FD-334 SS-4]
MDTADGAPAASTGDEVWNGERRCEWERSAPPPRQCAPTSFRFGERLIFLGVERPDQLARIPAAYEERSALRHHPTCRRDKASRIAVLAFAMPPLMPPPQPIQLQSSPCSWCLSTRSARPTTGHPQPSPPAADIRRKVAQSADSRIPPTLGTRSASPPPRVNAMTQARRGDTLDAFLGLDDPFLGSLHIATHVVYWHADGHSLPFISPPLAAPLSALFEGCRPSYGRVLPPPCVYAAHLRGKLHSFVSFPS